MRRAAVGRSGGRTLAVGMAVGAGIATGAVAAEDVRAGAPDAAAVEVRAARVFADWRADADGSAMHVAARAPGHGLQLFSGFTYEVRRPGHGALSDAAATAHAGPALDRLPVPVPARGFEFGVRRGGASGWQTSLALWDRRSGLDLPFGVDTGADERDRPIHRAGLEWTLRYAPGPRLAVEAGLAWTRARVTRAGPAGAGDPSPAERVASIAVTASDLGPWSLAIESRHRHARPLGTGDGTRRRSSFTTDLRLARRIGSRAELALEVVDLSGRLQDDVPYTNAWRSPDESIEAGERQVRSAQPRTVTARLSVVF